MKRITVFLLFLCASPLVAQDGGGLWKLQSDTLRPIRRGIATWSPHLGMDTLRLNGILAVQGSTPAADTNAFSGTAQTDTVTVAGLLGTETILVAPRGATVSGNDVLSAIPYAGKFVVFRPASGTSGLKYQYFIIRR